MRPSPHVSLVLLFSLTACGGGQEPSSTSATTSRSTSAKPGEEAAEPAEPEPIAGGPEYVSQPDPQKPIPLHQAARAGNLDAVKSLIEGGVDPNSPLSEKDPLTALHIAVGEAPNGEVFRQMAAFLLEKGADPNAKQILGGAPLHMAAAAGDVETSRLLLENEADVNIKDKRSITPLMAAACNGHLDELELLLDKDAEIDLHQADGSTALHGAVKYGQKDCAATLLARGADPNSVNNQKYTPLHVAAHENSREMVDLLLANGADILAKTEEGGTAFQLAAYKEFEALAKYLQELEQSATGETPGQEDPQKEGGGGGQ